MAAGTREAIDAAHERMGTPAGVIPGQRDFDGGETPQLRFFDLGGKRPTTSVLKLKAVTLDGMGPFQKGTTVTGTFEAEIREVSQKDTTDSETGQVVDSAQVHIAEVVDVSVD